MEERTREIAIEYLEHYKKVEYGMMPEWVWNMAIKALEQVAIIDKIRAEIEFIPTIEWKDDGTTYILASYFKKQVLEIIDKYKAESEDKDTR